MPYFAYNINGLGFKKIKLTHPLSTTMWWPFVGGFVGLRRPDFGGANLPSVVTSLYIGVNTCHDSKHNSTRITDHHAAQKLSFLTI